MRWRKGHFGLTAAICLGSSPAAAQVPIPFPPPFGMPPMQELELQPQAPLPALEPRASFRDRFGAVRGEALVLSSDRDAMLRGVARLGADGSKEAVAALCEALATGNTFVRSSPEATLEAVRALAPHAAQAEARKQLVSVLNGVRSSESPLDELGRGTAAMALARAGDDRAVTALVAALIGGGEPGTAARRALLAYPPKSLLPLLRGRKSLPPRVVELLGELGDVRVLGSLRQQLQQQNAQLAPLAAIALARLGDGHAIPAARGWLKGADSAPATAEVGAEVLALLDAPEAPLAIAQLIGNAKLRAAGLRLAARAPSAALVPTLDAVLDAAVTPAEKAQALAVLARIGGERANKRLAAALHDAKDDALAGEAALALARLEGADAREALAGALATAKDASRRRIVRAALVRWLRRAERVRGLDEAVEALLASDQAADRAVGGFGAALLGLRPLEALLASAQPEVARAAARAALALGPTALAACTPLLARAANEQRPGVSAIAAGGALLASPEAIATTQLARWAELGGPLAPLSALRLAARDSAILRERLVRLLHGTDPDVRLHAALGLGLSPEPDATSLLGEAYRFEPEARVRRAIVRALSLRPEKLRLRALELAAQLDPDDAVRALARAALLGRAHRLALPPVGAEVAWVEIAPNAPGADPLGTVRVGVLVRGDGVALPVVSDPDGALLLAGLALGDEPTLVLDRTAPGRAAPLAPAADSGNPSGDGER